MKSALHDCARHEIRSLIKAYRECKDLSDHNYDCIEGGDFAGLVYHEVWHLVYERGTELILERIKKSYQSRHDNMEDLENFL